MPTGLWLSIKRAKRWFYYEFIYRSWYYPNDRPVKCPMCGCKSEKLLKNHPKRKNVYLCENCNRMTYIEVIGERRRGEW